MAFQFIHMETFSRKSDKAGRSTSFIFDEAERQKHASVHVESPEPAIQVFGCSIAELREMHDGACQTFKTVNNKGQERAIRVDQNTLMTVVASHPYTPDECLEDVRKMAEYQKWEDDTVAWLREKYGDELKTVVRHMDESRMHIHAYVLPDNLRAFDLHPGVSSKRRVKAEALAKGEDGKTANKLGDAAYKENMRLWQDSYFDKVGVKHGLARLGPKLRRLSREEWQREKAMAQSLKKTIEKAAVLHNQGNQYIQNVKKKVSVVTGETKRLHSAAVEKERAARAMVEQVQDSAKKNAELNERAQKTYQNAQKMMKKARVEEHRILSSARSRAEKMLSFGTKVRSFLTGFRTNKIRNEIMSEAKHEIAKIDNERREALTEKFQEQRKRQETETRMHEALVRERDLKVKLSDAHAQIDKLKPGVKGPTRSIPKY